MDEDDSEDETASLELPELSDWLLNDELDELSDELTDSLDELAKLDDELLELSGDDETADELDADCELPNTALNCSSVTQVSPTQRFFTFTFSFSNVIPNAALNFSVIQANKESEPEIAPLPPEMPPADKAVISIFIFSISFFKSSTLADKLLTPPRVKVAIL